MDYTSLKKQIPKHLKDITIFQTAGSKHYGKLAIGFGLAEKVGEEAAKLGTGKVLVITDKTITKLGIHLVITDSLEKAGFELDIFDDVESEPHIETAQKIQEVIKKENYNLVVGLGGGSPMDMAKAASLAGTNTDDILDIIQGAPIVNEGLPSILIPTTSGTGSEVSPYIVTSKGDKKLFIGTPYVYATIALVDPLLTVTMPSKVTAATGLDALSHGVEGLIASPKPISEALTHKCVEYVFNYLERACNKGTDLEARYFMSFASVLGMMSYTQGGGLYAHSTSYILTLYNGLPHGIGCGVALPYTLMFNFDYIQKMLNKFAKIVGLDLKEPDEEVALKMIKKFHELLGKVDVPASLKELGISKEFVPTFADELVNKYYRSKNPRSMSQEEAHKFAELMFEGKLAKI